MPNVDLHAMSIDPLSQPKTGKVFKLTLIMRNNGPDTIPAGEAVAQISIDNRFITVPNNVGFSSNRWVVFKTWRKNNAAVIGFKTKADMPVNSQDELTITLKGKKKTTFNEPTKITAFSTLSFDATTGDVQAFNNQCDTEFEVK